VGSPIRGLRVKGIKTLFQPSSGYLKHMVKHMGSNNHTFPSKFTRMLAERKSGAYEPIAKLVSGDRLPHFDPFDSDRWPSGLAPRPCGRPNGLRPFCRSMEPPCTLTNHASLPRGGTAPLASRKWTRSGIACLRAFTHRQAAHPPGVLQLAYICIHSSVFFMA